MQTEQTELASEMVQSQTKVFVNKRALNELVLNARPRHVFTATRRQKNYKAYDVKRMLYGHEYGIWSTVQ